MRTGGGFVALTTAPSPVGNASGEDSRLHTWRVRKTRRVDRTGRLLWQIETGATVDSYPALTGDGALVVGVSDGRLLAIADD